MFNDDNIVIKISVVEKVFKNTKVSTFETSFSLSLHSSFSVELDSSFRMLKLSFLFTAELVFSQT